MGNVVRARASEFLHLFREDYFDFIYIDGSHYYEDIVEEIRLSKKLAKKSFSILCGDDYEMLHNAELMEFARMHPNRDFIYHPSGVYFHPGVMLAIHEELGEVNMENGFWWIFCCDGDWTKTKSD